MTTPRVLFLLKTRSSGPYGSWSYSEGPPLASGLTVSATQLTHALEELNIVNKLVQVIDNNDIDREVTCFKPTHVIVEAFWVVPDKFDVLRKLHPTVKWIIRNHSKSDFLSHEGGMVGWAIDYVQKGLTLACNSPEATEDFKRLAVSIGADPENVVYLPNYYRMPPPSRPRSKVKLWKMLRWLGVLGKPPVLKCGVWNVGCFGAVRPLKNHLHQALAAIETADRLGLSLRFWINGDRVEGRAEPIMTSLRQLFARYPQHTLVEQPWVSHDDFKRVAGSVDLVMQVSNSETFNIVAADAVAHNVPVLVSKEVPWLGHEYHANPNDVEAISQRLTHVWLGSGNGYLQADQLEELRTYTWCSKERWNIFLHDRSVSDFNHWEKMLKSKI